MILKYCMTCGTAIKPDTRFCGGCGQNLLIDQTATIAQQDLPVSLALPLTQNDLQNSPTIDNPITLPPELVFDHVLQNGTTQSVESFGPLKFLWKSFIDFVKGIGSIFKHKSRWIPAVFLILIWSFDSVRLYFGWEHPLFNTIAQVTFAEGGYTNSIIGLVGGLFGKGLVAFVFIDLISGLLSLQNPFTGVFKSIGLFLKSFLIRSFRDLSKLCFGLGLALVLYSFMSGVPSPQTIAAAVCGFILTMKALWHDAGFIKGFLLSLKRLFSKNKPHKDLGVNRLISGLSLGFCLAIPLSYSKVSDMILFGGAGLIVIGCLLAFVPANKKEAV